MQKINYKQLLLKKNKEPITCLTAYSKSLANILDSRVDLILIGDSLGTTLYGMKNTRNVTLEMMKNHGKAVVKNTKNSMTIVDMPYNTYRSKKEALKNSLEILKYTKADFIKIETDKNNIEIVKYLSDKKIRVVELPIGYWTDDFKQHIENLMEADKNKKGKAFIKDYNDMSTDTSVDVEITFNEPIDENVDGSNKYNNLEKMLKLYASLSANNMHLFNEDEKLMKFDSL